MRFAQPEFLAALWILPILVTVIAVARVRRRRRCAAFADLALFDQLVPDLASGRRLLREGLRLAAIACLILALARPQFGQRLSVLTREGIDIMVAIDTSASMMAPDAGPQTARLDAARRMVAGLTDELRGDRIGVVVFAGDAFIQCPLTLDYGAARMLLAAVGSETVPTPGTAIGEAIDRSLSAFDDEGPWKVIVLCTDGEDHEGEPLAAARRAADAGVRIFTVGFGADRGELIPVTNPGGEQIGYKRDAKGELVVSRLDERILERIAAETGGRYIRAAGGAEIDELYLALDALEKREIEGGFHRHYEDRFHVFAVAAFALLAVARVLGERRGGFRLFDRRSVAAATVALALSGLGLAWRSAPARAESLESDVAGGNRALRAGDVQSAIEHYLDAVEKDPERPEVHYNLGNAHYTAGVFDQALGAYAQAAERADSSLAQALSYNLGNALFRQGDVGAAIEAYKEALRRDPSDRDAKWNLELALRQAEKEQQQDQQQEQDQQQQEQQQQQEPQERSDPGQQSDASPPDDSQEQPQDDDSQEPDRGEEPRDDNPAAHDDEERSDEPGGTAAEEPQSGDDLQSQPAAAGEDRMSPEDARRWLKALGDDELELLKERFRAHRRRVNVEKDW